MARRRRELLKLLKAFAPGDVETVTRIGTTPWMALRRELGVSRQGIQRSDLSQAVLSRPLGTDRWVSLAHPFQAICEIEQLLLDFRNWCLPS